MTTESDQPAGEAFPATTRRTPTTPSSLLIDIHELGRLLNRSRPSLERDMAAGRLPIPLKLGRLNRWRRDEIHEWIQAGVPPRKEWDAMWASKRRQPGGR